MEWFRVDKSDWTVSKHEVRKIGGPNKKGVHAVHFGSGKAMEWSDTARHKWFDNVTDALGYAFAQSYPLTDGERQTKLTITISKVSEN
jgi:hypothetical protein